MDENKVYHSPKRKKCGCWFCKNTKLLRYYSKMVEKVSDIKNDKERGLVTKTLILHTMERVPLDIVTKTGIMTLVNSELIDEFRMNEMSMIAEQLMREHTDECAPCANHANVATEHKKNGSINYVT